MVYKIFHIYNCNISLVIAVEIKGRHTENVRTATMLFFYIIEIITLM
jgi:hypothetical protein